MKKPKGVALALAVTLALLVSLLAAVVLSVTFRRFNLSFFQESRAIAFSAAEGGLQYADARLRLDTTYTDSNFPGVNGFANVVKTKSAQSGNPPYLVSSFATTAAARAAGHIDSREALDKPDIADLQMGSAVKKKEVTLRITEEPSGSGRFKVQAKASYGPGI
ncbi:MAG: hypothetical protein HY211_07230 [Candidatus Omnitrophica bacterium]|nr:hypothetical protein [Candidatus Omnitrophota bacterium]